jgi:type VI secretion system protein VasD
MKMFRRSGVILTLLLGGCGAWQAASDTTSNAYDSMFHNRGKTINVDVSADPVLNQDSAGRSRSVAVRVYQLKDRKRFDEASYGDLVAKDTTVLAPDMQASMAGVINPGGAASFSQPMQQDTKYVAIAAFYRNAQQTGLWKRVIKSQALSADKPLRLTLANTTLDLPNDDAQSGARSK